MFLLLILAAVAEWDSSVADPDGGTAPEAQPTQIYPDGRLSPEEWEDANPSPLSGGAQVLQKRTKSTWLLGIRLPPKTPRYVDIYVRDARGRILNLHASMQQGERTVSIPWTDVDPPYRWGKSLGWESSTAPRSVIESEVGAKAVDFEGYEFAVPLAHLGDCPLSIRVEVRDYFGKAQDWSYPEVSSRENPSSWAPMLPGC